MTTALTTYIENIKNINPNDKEHTYRTHLENLLTAITSKLNPKIRIIHEPLNDKDGNGAPDFRFDIYDGLLVGYLENKRVGEDLDKIAQSPQIQKYQKMSKNIILCDYLNFILLDENGKQVQKVEISNLNNLSYLAKNIKNPSVLKDTCDKLEELFNIFLNKNPNPINTAIDFADSLARKTQILKQELQSEKIEIIEEIFKLFKNTIYKDIEYEEFCDNFAQTLTYSLFLAKLNKQGSEKIDFYNVTKYIPQSFSLIRSMSRFLLDLGDTADKNINSNTLKWIIGEILSVINHIDSSMIIKDLNKIGEKNILQEHIHKDPYIHFYETFLGKYDLSLKKTRGVYYTPSQVVDFIINSIDSILKNDFNITHGLSDATRSDSKITLLDFATGTGTFLLEAFRKALENKSKVERDSYAIPNLIKRFYGFEFMIAPYVVAHLKLSQTLSSEYGYTFDTDDKETNRLKVYLTNTIQTIETSPLDNLFANELIKEVKLAQDTKEKDILIITGNPPYSGASANKGIYENEVRDAYHREPGTESKLQNEKNPKWLLDDYVKFIRFAEMKIEKSGYGIFAFISNNGFIDNPTFRGMRYHLYNTFDKIYILDLHGSTRKKEVAPNGEIDKNVFDIMQGVSINIFVKKPNSDQNLCKVLHYDLYGSRRFKYDFLQSNALDSIKWNQLNPKEPFYLFVPQNENLESEYNKAISVKDIFLVNSVGVVSARDNLAIQNTDDKVWEAMQDILHLEKQDLYLKYNLPKDVRDWRYEWAKDDVTQNNDKSKIQKISYRPFDTKYIFYSGKSRGFLCYPRYDVMTHLIDRDDNFAFVCGRGCGLKLNNMFVTEYILDSGLAPGASGVCYAFPLYLYDTPSARKAIMTFNNKNKKSSKADDDTLNLFEEDASMNPFLNKEKIENFTPDFREFVNHKYGEVLAPEIIVGYIYAILFHKGYKDRYISFLRVDFPKIVFVDNKDDFLELSQLGQNLIKLHLLKDRDLDKDIAKPDTITKDYIKTIIKAEYKNKQIYINDSLYFDNISAEIWQYQIGNNPVLSKYLKDHKGDEIDIEHFTTICQILAKTINIEEKIFDIKIFDV